MEQIRQFFANQPRANIIGIFIILCTAVIAPFFGGWDYLVAVRGETLSEQYVYTYNPYPAYWVFYLFAMLPPRIGYILWNLTNAAAFIYALRHWNANILAFAVSVVCFWNFFGGQCEGFFAAGFVLAATANPLLAGVGIFLLTFKPQVGLLPIVFVLLQRRDWRILVIPGIIYLLSFVVYGWWIPEWLQHIHRSYQNVIISNTNLSLYPLGLIFLLLIVIYHENIKVWILAASLAMPYYPIYSLAVFFTMEAPHWWFSLALWMFYILPGFIKNSYDISKFAFMIPLTLLATQIWKANKNRREGSQS